MGEEPEWTDLYYFVHICRIVKENTGGYRPEPPTRFTQRKGMREADSFVGYFEEEAGEPLGVENKYRSKYQVHRFADGSHLLVDEEDPSEFKWFYENSIQEVYDQVNSLDEVAEEVLETAEGKPILSTYGMKDGFILLDSDEEEQLKIDEESQAIT